VCCAASFPCAQSRTLRSICSRRLGRYLTPQSSDRATCWTILIVLGVLFNPSYLTPRPLQRLLRKLGWRRMGRFWRLRRRSFFSDFPAVSKSSHIPQIIFPWGRLCFSLRIHGFQRIPCRQKIRPSNVFWLVRFRRCSTFGFLNRPQVVDYEYIKPSRVMKYVGFF
jgi:hypothetical protein